MAARFDRAPIQGLEVVVIVGALFLCAGAPLAGYSVWPAKANRVRAPRYLLSCAALLFVATYTTCIGTVLVIWHRGRDYTLNTWDHEEKAFFTLITLFHGLFSLVIVAACRAAFYQLTANKLFRPHRVAKRVFMGFDGLIIISGLSILLVTAFSGMPCCEGGPQTAGDIIMAAVFDATASYGFQYFIFAEHVVIITSAIFARKWTRRYDSGVSLASAMLIVLSPLLVLQTMLLLVMTIVHFDGDIRGTDYLDFYVSIPWRIAQAVVLWVLIWMFRTRPIRSEEGQTKIEASSRVINEEDGEGVTKA